MAFVDTSIFVAALNKRDVHHRKGKKLLTEAFKRFKWLYASDYVFDETLKVVWAKTRKINLCLLIDEIIQGI